MRVSLLALTAAAALAVGPALAQSANITINGTIGSSCSAITGMAPNVTIPAASFADSGSVGALASAFTGSGGIAITNTSAAVTCNGAGSKITVDAAPMNGPALPANAGSNGFSNTINYRATVSKPDAGFAQFTTSGNVIASNDTTSNATVFNVGLLASNLSVSVSNASAGGVLVAGTYQGSIAISLTPGT